MKELTIEKLQNLETNMDFLTELQNASTTEEKLQVLADHGIELTVEEYENACAQMYDLLEEKLLIADGELTEADMGMVSGGMNYGVTWTGALLGAVGLGVMMTGGGVALWAVGCCIGWIGIMGMKRRR